MWAAAYIRVSTPGQVKLQTIGQQLETTRGYAREKGWELSDENVFCDDGYSGATEASGFGCSARQGAAQGAGGRRGALPGSAGLQLRSPDRLDRRAREGRLSVEFTERPMSSEPNDQL